ncbi:MAG: redoxin family protein [Planctomycetes bacterium]|nr:redoxin family protein [Planctomycetota bacterium]
MKTSWALFFLALAAGLIFLGVRAIVGTPASESKAVDPAAQTQAGAQTQATGDHAGLRSMLDGKLADAHGAAISTDALKDKRFVLLYFSAGWCPPCHQFTPKLVEFYNAHGGGKDFEVVFVSSDADTAKMQEYIDEYKMPWLAVKHDQIKASGLQERYAGNGIPDLEMLDGTGQVLSSSFAGKSYRGPYEVLKDLEKALK